MAFAGAIAGMVEALVTMPFEVVKTRQQIEASRRTQFLTCFKDTLKTSGVRGLYAGLPVMVAQSGGKVALRFGIYGYAKEAIPRYPVIAGVLAGSAEAALWITPCERLKVLLIKKRDVPNRLAVVFKSMYKEGLRSLYKGATPTILRNGGTVGVRMAAFDKIYPIVGNAAAAGALVGAITTVMNNPIDVLKSHVQAVEKQEKELESNLLSTARKLVKLHGWNYLLTAGLSARLVKISLGQAVIFQTVSWLK